MSTAISPGLISLLLTAVLSVPALAQQAEEPAAPEPPAAQEPAEPNPEPAPETAPARENSPFEYEASEQISEDLSVSFPVDI